MRRTAKSQQDEMERVFAEQLEAGQGPWEACQAVVTYLARKRAGERRRTTQLEAALRTIAAKGRDKGTLFGPDDMAKIAAIALDED